MERSAGCVGFHCGDDLGWASRSPNQSRYDEVELRRQAELQETWTAGGRVARQLPGVNWTRRTRLVRNQKREDSLDHTCQLDHASGLPMQRP